MNADSSLGGPFTWPCHCLLAVTGLDAPFVLADRFPNRRVSEDMRCFSQQSLPCVRNPYVCVPVFLIRCGPLKRTLTTGHTPATPWHWNGLGGPNRGEWSNDGTTKGKHGQPRPSAAGSSQGRQRTCRARRRPPGDRGRPLNAALRSLPPPPSKVPSRGLHLWRAHHSSLPVSGSCSSAFRPGVDVAFNTFLHLPLTNIPQDLKMSLCFADSHPSLSACLLRSPSSTHANLDEACAHGTMCPGQHVSV